MPYFTGLHNESSIFYALPLLNRLMRQIIYVVGLKKTAKRGSGSELKRGQQQGERFVLANQKSSPISSGCWSSPRDWAGWLNEALGPVSITD